MGLPPFLDRTYSTEEEVLVMSENIILDKVKKALLIPISENYADDELLIHIASCRQLLITTGVPSETAEDNNNPLVQALIITYVKTNFGFKSDGTVKELPSSFDLLLRQLCLHSEEEPNSSKEG